MTRPNLSIVDNELSGVTPQIQRALDRAAEAIRPVIADLEVARRTARHDAANRLREVLACLHTALEDLTYDYDEDSDEEATP